MITLKIKQPGHAVAIPGLPALRSPVEVDISKLDVRVVAMYLKSSGITKYEIIAETKTQKEIYTKKDFEAEEPKKPTKSKEDWQKRFNRLESMLENLLTVPRNENKSEEQIINKLDKLENILSNVSPSTSLPYSESKDKNSEKEDVYSFIPDVDIEDMKVQSSDNIKKVKQDEGIEDSADILAGLMKKK